MIYLVMFCEFLTKILLESIDFFLLLIWVSACTIKQIMVNIWEGLLGEHWPWAIYLHFQK